MTLPCKHISVSINRAPQDVYAFASDPQNLPQWAAGLSSGIQKLGNDWITDSPMGRVGLKFAERNEYGVLDHIVTMPSGETVYNPMRIIANGDGSEVIFTLYRRSDMTDETFKDDSDMVQADLNRLKRILEG